MAWSRLRHFVSNACAGYLSAILRQYLALEPRLVAVGPAIVFQATRTRSSKSDPWRDTKFLLQKKIGVEV